MACEAITGLTTIRRVLKYYLKSCDRQFIIWLQMTFTPLGSVIT